MTLLGPFRLTAGEREIPTPAAKQKAILALLALEPDGRLAHDRITALLWSDRGEAQARDSLKHALSDLRTLLGGVGGNLLTSQHGIAVLDLGWLSVDARDLAALQSSGDRMALSRALAAGAGELLEGLSVRDPAFEDWLRDERRAWRTRRETAAARVLSLAMQDGDDAAIAAAARHLITLDPLHEGATRELMRQLSASGEKAGALRLHAALSERLRTELATAPEAETDALAEAIRSGNLRPGSVPEAPGTRRRAAPRSRRSLCCPSATSPAIPTKTTLPRASRKTS